MRTLATPLLVRPNKEGGASLGRSSILATRTSLVWFHDVSVHYLISSKSEHKGHKGTLLAVERIWSSAQT